MKHFLLIVVVVVTVSGCVGGPEDHQPSTASATRPATQPTTSPDQVRRETLEIGGEKFQLEVAADPASRTKGLMGRKEIAPDGGMLFIYPRLSQQTLWMANCPIDIDVVFLDVKGKIVSMYEMKAEDPQGHNESRDEYEARLMRYLSVKPVFFAIELKAGTIKRLKLQRGQTIQIESARLRKLAS